MIAATLAKLELSKRHYVQLQWRFGCRTIWSYLWTQPVPGLPERALLITRHPTVPGRKQATWAWWNNGFWIGPRHTNMGPELGGSVCAFDVTDGISEDDHTTYLDLISLWTARQLYFSIRGRWPGMQVLHTAYERLEFHGPDEFCGCTSGKLYADCCQTPDLVLSKGERIAEFRQVWPRPGRRIPEDVLRFRADLAL